jgi:glycerophosphoryl diester phosphodiesterase
LRERGFVAVSAHRGGPGPGLAENAIPTFRNTLIAARGAFLEVDVSQTADGVLVLMHDDRADRTTTGTGAIKKPVLLHNPMKDSFIPVEALNTIRETLKSNPLVTIYEYAEQDHAFTREGGAHYDEAAKQLADGRTIAFLKQHLA